MPTILVVDDVSEDLRAMQRGAHEALIALGGRVEIALDAESAIEKLRRTHFDVVVVDVQLTPQRNNDGWDVLQYARKRHPDTKVIVVTVYSDAEVKDKAIKLGAFDYIGKLQQDLVEETKAVVLDALEAL